MESDRLRTAGVGQIEAQDGPVLFVGIDRLKFAGRSVGSQEMSNG